MQSFGTTNWLEISKLIVEALKALAWPGLIFLGGFAYRRHIGQLLTETLALIPMIRNAKIGALEFAVEQAEQLKDAVSDKQDQVVEIATQLAAAKDSEKEELLAKVTSLTNELTRLQAMERSYRTALEHSQSVMHINWMEQQRAMRYESPRSPYSEPKKQVMRSLTQAIGPDWIVDQSKKGDVLAILSKASEVIEQVYASRNVQVPHLNSGSMTGIRGAGMLDGTGRQLSPLGYLELIKLAQELATK